MQDANAHLHEYELLYDRLYQRIRTALLTDDLTRSEELAAKYGLSKRLNL